MVKLIIIVAFVINTMTSIGQTLIDWSYPPLVAGSSWGNVFQRYYINGDYNTMLLLTSNESIAKYGRDSILKYYQQMQFAYPLKLKSWTRENKYYVLNYTATIQATTTTLHLRLLAGDTAKLVLPDDYKTQKYFLYK